MTERAMKIDRWVQRVTLACLLALAATLVGAGIALYASPARAEGARPVVSATK